MKVEVRSEHTIKPSTPTPNHHRHFQLSFLDQIQQPNFQALVYFYQSPPSAAGERLGALRKSLGETLTWYYPLAGRVKDNTFVDCNDEGVPFLEAQVVDCNLLDVVEERNYENINKLFPFPEKANDAGDLLLAVQVNVFSCGGLAIGVSVSHKIADALSVVTFMKFWAAVARGDRQGMAFPQFGSAKVFPPKPTTTHIKRVGENGERKIVTRSFLFSSRAISALKSKYAAQGNHKTRISRVDALTAFIATTFLASSVQENENSERQKTSLFIIQAVNLRPKVNPPLQDSVSGNLSRFASAWVDHEDDGGGYNIITKMREALKKVDGEYVKRLQEGNTGLHNNKSVGEEFQSSRVVNLTFTSFSRFPLYETDFGWGKPLWMTSKTIELDRFVIFISTESGDDIEAVINMNEEDMMNLEKEFMKSGSLISNPKVSIISSL